LGRERRKEREEGKIFNLKGIDAVVGRVG